MVGSFMTQNLHTGLIGSKFKIIQKNYVFKGCISLKTLKLWLLVLSKTFFDGNTHGFTALIISLQDLYTITLSTFVAEI